jgi:hypothetical protein
MYLPATEPGRFVMRKRMSLASMALAGLALSLPGVAFGQGAVQANLYSFHSGRIGDCPGLDWHVNVESSGKVTGMVGWDNMTHMASLAGTMQPDGKFSLTAKEVGGPKTATVTGLNTGSYATITITGTGGPCDGKTVQVPRPNAGFQR